MDSGKAFIDLRERILGGRHAGDRNPPADLRWPDLPRFNWARDYFDRIAADNDAPALKVVDDAGHEEAVSFAALSRRSHQVAAFLSALGVRPGDRLLIMLGNVVPLWEAMLAAINLGAVIIPATTLLQRADLEDRLVRGRVRAVIADGAHAALFEGLAGAPIRISVGREVPGWHSFEQSREADPTWRCETPTRADDLMMLYFTSGTTSKPKLVAHSHVSYPVGHLSTAYWIGLRRGDVTSI